MVGWLVLFCVGVVSAEDLFLLYCGLCLLVVFALFSIKKRKEKNNNNNWVEFGWNW